MDVSLSFIHALFEMDVIHSFIHSLCISLSKMTVSFIYSFFRIFIQPFILSFKMDDSLSIIHVLFEMGVIHSFLYLFYEFIKKIVRY